MSEIERDENGVIVCHHGEPRGSSACALCRAAARTQLEGRNPYVRPRARAVSTPMPQSVRDQLDALRARRVPDADAAVQSALSSWWGDQL